MKKFSLLAIGAALALGFGCTVQKVSPPEPYGATPSKAQVAWQQLEYYMFIHFGPNTFTDKEWGHGDEDPKVFNPTQLDARQWARTAKAAGMKGIIITAKHHDGFCLWPSKYSTHTVRESAWKNGKGDVLRELSDACKEYGLKFGVYLSPWDRNHPLYGTPEYNQIFANTLTEVLTSYGQVFEQWFDGANGEGPNGRRQIYDWPLFHKTVYQHQPQAIIFSDGGPGTRWIGNERGIGGETNWSTLNADKVYPGYPHAQELTTGHEDGTHWVPAEADVSIRPGWFYSPSTDDKVKSLNHLLQIYYASQGRNANLLLNVPVDRRGLIHANDSTRLIELRKVLDETFKTNLAQDKKVLASNTRAKAKAFQPENLTDNDYDTYWATDDAVRQASFTLDLGSPTEINRILLQEYIPLGQRVKSFSVEVWDGQQFQELSQHTTIGYKRILTFPTRITSRVKVNILEAKASPVLAELQVYKAPEMLAAPEIIRDRKGLVHIRSESIDPVITFTTDGQQPTINSPRYTTAFALPGAGTVKARAFIDNGKQASETITADFDVSPVKWQVASVSDEARGFEAAKAFDANPRTYWLAKPAGNAASPPELAIDLGEPLKLSGFTYTPRQDNKNNGTLYRYNFYVSADGKNWQKVIDQGTFANIRNNPVRQEVKFGKPYQARYIRLQGLSSVNDQENLVSAAEIGILTK